MVTTVGNIAPESTSAIRGPYNQARAASIQEDHFRTRAKFSIRSRSGEIRSGQKLLSNLVRSGRETRRRLAKSLQTKLQTNHVHSPVLNTTGQYR
jgi:hypothetical protein